MKPLRIIALVAGAWGIVVGVWGISIHKDAADSPGDIQSGFLWVAIGILTLAVAIVATNLAARRD
jgi:hypothetical protein